LADVVVVPYGGGQGEHASQDADPVAGGGMSAVALEAEPALERVVVDSMTWRSGLQNRAPGRSGSPAAGRAQQVQSGAGQCGFEVAAGIADHIVAKWHGHDETVMRNTYTKTYMDDLRAAAQQRALGGA